VRILLLTPGFVAEDGPACVPALIDLLTNLKARHTLDVHAIVPPPASRGRLEQRGIPIRAYGDRPRWARFSELVTFLAARPSYDLVWSLWIDRSGWAGVVASRMLGRPLLLSVMARELSGARLGLRAMAACARRITVGSRVLVESLRSMAPSSSDRIRCTPLGIPRLSPRTEGRRDRPAKIVAVTTLHPAKRPQLLLRVLRDRDGATLDVYGWASREQVDEWMRVARELGVADRVRHRGFIDPDQMRARYREYDLLLHASAYESQGMALIEAAASDLPIACFDVGVASELKELGATVVIAGDDLGAAAARALDAGSSHAAARVLERFSIDRTTADFEAVLEETAA
jgi:glycosyltransferase involved in cell wall biosynthesis